MRTKEELQVLVAEIKDELSKLESLAGKLSSQKGRTSDEEIAESAALRLHNFYTGCERIFKLIAAEINGGTPQDLEWHKRLLNQVSIEIDGVRPAVISPQNRRELEKLLRFRHLVRNIYGFELESNRIEELLVLAVNLFPLFKKEVESFTEFLVQVYKNV